MAKYFKDVNTLEEIRNPGGSDAPYEEIVYGDIKKIKLYQKSINGLVNNKILV